MAKDTRNDRDLFCEGRNLFREEVLDPHVLETDRVEHARRNLGDPGWGITHAGLEGETLGDDPSQAP